MLLRDAQEQVRVLNAARRNSAGGQANALGSQVAEVSATLQQLAHKSPSDWKNMIRNKDKAVGLMLLVVLGVANELEVDGLEALRATLVEESP